MKKNAFYAQSGGVTSVINASASGVIEECRKLKKYIDKVYAGRNGILGAINDDLIDTSFESAKAIENLKFTPGGAFGSCRYKLSDVKKSEVDYQKILNTFEKYNIGYFFYNGGGDSQDTTNKLSKFCKLNKYDISCIGIPKTVDNDLPFIDNCPGFGSVAKYVSTSILEAGLDVASMSETSTKVFVMEVMGRHAGWIAASAALAGRDRNLPPHIILFPEIEFNKKRFLQEVKKCVSKHGYCVIVASEGVKAKGKFLTESSSKDAFGHAQLGGLAPLIVEMIKSNFNYKCHWAVADYLQRSARHLSSKVDVDQAYKLGKFAVQQAVQGNTDRMVSIKRISSKPYKWKLITVPLSKVANVEKKLPKNYISSDGFYITSKCRDYLQPLIYGELGPTYKNGIPVYSRLKNIKAK